MTDVAPHGGPPPWINPAMQAHIPWRKDDIVIAVPPKSGTTWTMNIVYQLLMGGRTDFADIYAEVPWIEFVSRPGMPVEELLTRLDRQPRNRPRAFKTHSAPPTLPYQAPSTGVRYIVVARNPEEAIVSMRPFMAQHSDALLAAWGIPRAAIEFPDFDSYYRGFVDAMGFHFGLFAFLTAWWPLRHESNVLFIHFNDMKRDLAASVERIAKFLGIVPTAAQWPSILEYTSFAWMKQHDVKFDGLSAEIPPIKPGAMVRNGRAGSAQEEGVTAEYAARIRAVGETLCQDAAALRWFYAGGAI